MDSNIIAKATFITYCMVIFHSKVFYKNSADKTTILSWRGFIILRFFSETSS